MRILYYLSHVLHMPFLILAIIFEVLGDVFRCIGENIHDATTYHIWVALHKRAIKEGRDKEML